ncbi:MAG: Gfo/Idh/MocA family oxidoreductase [Mariniblastus sp.]|nr:Gfo/Idh/MocA family oxidoreductase [Mariniblastus sp.]
MSQQKSQTTRRQFIGNGTKIAAAGVAAGSLLKPKLSLARSAHAFGSDTIKIGLVGCGGRGTGAAIQAMNTTSGNVELVAMADAFGNRLESSLNTCAKKHKEKVRVPKENQHVGFDAYKEVMASDADMVLLATPPGFRPLHLEAAIDAGKHVFMEKPVAVDAPGVRRVLAAGEKAKEKNLAIAVGLQRRHERAYRETIDQLQNGAIGDFVLSRAYWNGGGVWVRPRTDDQSEMEYQMRNWYYFNWLCGDHIVEQHIHNLDVINWLMDGYPVTAQGQGGRLVRNGQDHGQIYDHHFIEFTYADGSKMFSQCRHIRQCYNNVSEHVHGTKGSCDISGAKIYDADGQQIFHSKAGRGGHQQEHHDLFADLRAGAIPNEAEYGAKSTMTSIFGRLATYTGKMLKWEDAINSNLSLANVDEMASMTGDPPVMPDEDGNYPVPKPGPGAKESMDWG